MLRGIINLIILLGFFLLVRLFFVGDLGLLFCICEGFLRNVFLFLGVGVLGMFGRIV